MNDDEEGALMGTPMMGTLEHPDGRWRLRFTRALAHPPEKVWRAITEPEHLQAWFPQRITGDWVVGGTADVLGRRRPRARLRRAGARLCTSRVAAGVPLGHPM